MMLPWSAGSCTKNVDPVLIVSHADDDLVALAPHPDAVAARCLAVKLVALIGDVFREIDLPLEVFKLVLACGHVSGPMFHRNPWWGGRGRATILSGWAALNRYCSPIGGSGKKALHCVIAADTMGSMCVFGVL